ncbi:asparagine synthase B [Pseudobacteriovorax antillogorgiicola]|uniref:asparagine synthase (glutamine-hydrolyzing) n=1 Tax=Pseudobacteriovorax antillogorgiicola TaxID=1513793 RepID=A0A1Y6CH64_9BACT|nr:asparagine synthase B [Pseudobacteriovorax antillogorgiicola]TCS47292.1 asparagine synthase (glutamine-hydrolysing) [Pseudobacteriovorax antillogorgiicola]SMF62402.1 asparagine synthase (glutamine-hydrolysing) [Pseudobacteriovorax antillogorgiicola]
MCGLFAFQGSSLSEATLTQSFDQLVHRGPDQTHIHIEEQLFIGFHRLSIMDLSSHGMQPFISPYTGNILICNGEIYNHEEIHQEFAASFPFQSQSDCEVLLPLIQEYGIDEASRRLDGEFAIVVYDKQNNALLASRDPIGIRPLFYGYTKYEDEIAFASEAKALHSICRDVKPFPPGHYYDGEGNFIPYRSMSHQPVLKGQSMDSILSGIRQKLTLGVEKRLESDAPLGFLLSGGLDSSLVCALAARSLKKPIQTFAVGCDRDAIDIKYAERVATHIGADHTNVYFTIEEALEALKKVIFCLETWDITTIRASVGMYLVCQYIHKNTNIKVLLTGEVSDELFGYKYTDYAPSGLQFQKEARKRVEELHYYDVLRADRCISAHSLEARVPFGDLDFVDHVMSIDPDFKMNRHNMGKYLLRKAFDDKTELLPHDILFREKAAFSDAVGHSVVDEIKAYAERTISDHQFQGQSYSHGQPLSKEALLYRHIFESFFPNRAELIPGYWMPNPEWTNCEVLDPSARVLPNYGASGA